MDQLNALHNEITSRQQWNADNWKAYYELSEDPRTPEADRAAYRADAQRYQERMVEDRIILRMLERRLENARNERTIKSILLQLRLEDAPDGTERWHPHCSWGVVDTEVEAAAEALLAKYQGRNGEQWRLVRIYETKEISE